MKLFAAILAKLLQSGLIIAGLMAVLFVGYLALTSAAPTVRTFVEAPEQLHQIKHELRESEEAIAARNAEVVEYRRLMESIQEQIEREEDILREEFESNVEAVKKRAEEHKAHVIKTVEDNRSAAARSIGEVEARYCDSYNPLNWLTCQSIRRKKADFQESLELQREALTNAASRLEENAREQAENLREESARALEERTAEMQSTLNATVERLEGAEADRQALEARLEALRGEEALIYEQHWVVLELKERWPGLLFAALLIFFAPYLRRTFWYFVGMPIVARARPIELVSPTAKGELRVGKSARTIEVDIATGGRLRARSGYIQSDKEGARTDLLFDWKAPNLSYLSGLVLLTRLEAGKDVPAGRQVTLGSPDDPDAYLMEIQLGDHPGVVLKARNVVAVKGDVRVRSTWRIKSWHAWATSQVRFLLFSGTGSIIVEGFGDVADLEVGDKACEKRMPLVIGFDGRLKYHTRRAATFLPYLLDPTREPLVVDVFEGDGVFFYQKNPTSSVRGRGTERVGNFFLEAFRRLLGL
ncbi:MAG: hypothetical protein ACNA8W_15110 [Bradymonadaceae bacterium]